MAMRSVLSRGSVTRSMESSRGAMSRYFSDKGRVLSEEEQAKENVYIKKWERERLEKQKEKAEKEKVEKEKESADKALKVYFSLCPSHAPKASSSLDEKPEGAR
ncbi:beta-mannosyltransferase 4-like [Senna tora]|uniref:Beta-mannosyltransferase 4-like n=1 Tax=Senna tora TaxID=362788 RepID=A0A834SXH4_9FABA|nr:beta-mannosyltransferase 4-like [Senna tora]